MKKQKLRTVHCTECGQHVPLSALITDKHLVATYGEGCQYFGHTISLKNLRKLKNKNK